MARTVPSTPIEWALGAVAFALELAIVIGAGIVGYRLAATAAGAWPWLSSIVTVVVVLAFWARWMAPTSDHRIALTPRLIVAAGLLIAVSVGLWLTGSPVLGGILAIAGVPALVVAQIALSTGSLG